MTAWLNRRSLIAFVGLLAVRSVMAPVGLLLVAGALMLHAQAPRDTARGVAPGATPGTTLDAAQIGRQLRERYDIVALQGGVGLVPHRLPPIGADVPNAAIRLIEIRDGTVSINGEAVTARELRTRLGANGALFARDADLILRVTYLDAAAQRELVGAGAALKGSTALKEGTALKENTAPQESATGSQVDDPGEEDPAAFPERSRTRRGDLVRIGGNVTVVRGELVNGDVVAVFGSANVDGEVTRDVTVVLGSLQLGPNAVVRGNVTVVGGGLERAAGARVFGKVDDVAFGDVHALSRRGDWPMRGVPPWATFWRVGSLVGTLLRISLLLLGALLVVALGGRFVDAIADRTAAEPLRSGLAGLTAEVLFAPLLIVTVVALAVSIIGIPLLLLVPFAIVLALVLMLVGFTGVACQVGRALSVRFGVMRGAYASVALGVLAILGITVVAHVVGLAGGLVWGGVVGIPLAAVGYFVEYVAWTVGAGAVILTWLSTRRPSPVVAPVPPASGGETPGA